MGAVSPGHGACSSVEMGAAATDRCGDVGRGRHTGDADVLPGGLSPISDGALRADLVLGAGPARSDSRLASAGPGVFRVLRVAIRLRPHRMPVRHRPPGDAGMDRSADVPYGRHRARLPRWGGWQAAANFISGALI